MIALLAIAASILPHGQHYDGCNGRICDERVARKQCSQIQPRWCVERAIITYRLHGWQASWLRRIPGCESGWRWWARNPSGASGLMQFMPSTWATTPYGNRWILSNKYQALAAAWMLERGRANEWECT